MQKKTALCVAAWLAALCLCLFAADRLTRRPESALKYDAFFAQKQEDAFDVFLLGTSHMFDGVYPTELWREYGITSYNLGNSSEPLNATEWTLRMALASHKPKVAVIDVFYVNKQPDEAWMYPYRHLFLDAFPLSALKVQAVRETLPKDQWLEFLMPFSLYHGRWAELLTGTTEMTVFTDPCLMGAEMRLLRRHYTPYTRTQAISEQEQPGEVALRRIIALCRAEGIEPALICIPSPASQEEQMALNRVQLLADELDVPYLNMHDDNPVIFEDDMYDESHLNPDGALKVTHRLGEWLCSLYDLPDRRGDAQTSAVWDAILQTYDAFFAEHWGDLSLVRPNQP